MDPRMIHPLTNKKILLGICGGIAAYKIPELVRMLQNQGAQVQVVMTEHAKAFVTPLTLEILSQKNVYDNLFAKDFESKIGHIQLARWPDIVLIAPCTANFMAKLRYGMADDLLSTLCLATPSSIILAPAMNQLMWAHTATQENLSVLKQRGIQIIDPENGYQACGDYGVGRLVENTTLIECLKNYFSNLTMTGKKILITAGPTQEAIDPVRYIANASSGKMGYAIAKAMALSGGEVTLISGPTALDCPFRVKRINVKTAQEMLAAVQNNLPCDIFIGAAAVADYRPESISKNKIKRVSEEYHLRLIKNPDILFTVANSTPKPFTVGFAAETEHHVENARKKLFQKNLDMVVMNPVESGEVFNSEFNQVTIMTQNHQYDLPKLTKQEIAFQMIKMIGEPT